MNPNEMPKVTVGATGEQLKAFMAKYEGEITAWSDELSEGGMVRDGLNDNEVTMLIDELATKAGGNLDAVTPEMLEEIKGRAQYIVRQKNLPPNERD